MVPGVTLMMRCSISPWVPDNENAWLSTTPCICVEWACQNGQRGPVSPQKGGRMPYVFGAYHLDPQRYELHHAGVLVLLRPKVFQVLAYLVAQHDRVVRTEELLEALWPGRVVG